MTTENNEVRIFGIKPAHDTDDFPVTQADKNLLKLTIHLMAWHAAGPAWKEVLCDVNGKLIIDPTAMFENPPTNGEEGKGPSSNWAFDHNADASAHHAKYTDAEAKLVNNPLSIPPCQFVPYNDTYLFSITDTRLQNRTVLSNQYFLAALNFPNGVTITKMTLYGYRTAAGGNLTLYLKRTSFIEVDSLMAQVSAGWTDGLNSGYDDSISFSVIDNTTYAYHLIVAIDPGVAGTDAFLTGAKIEFTG